MNAFQKKLRIDPEADIQLLFTSDDLGMENAVLHNSIDTIPLNCNWVMVFVKSIAELNSSLGQIGSKIKTGGIVWWAFPKKSSKIKTDLSRDNGWDKLGENGFHFLNLVSLNETWSAFGTRFDLNAERKPLRKANNLFPEFIDTDNRKVTLPPDLENALNEFPECLAYYESLAFSHKKEYVVWILSAKKDETRRNRLEKMIQYLSDQRKNPSA
jgi:hypothetical protein